MSTYTRLHDDSVSALKMFTGTYQRPCQIVLEVNAATGFPPAWTSALDREFMNGQVQAGLVLFRRWVGQGSSSAVGTPLAQGPGIALAVIPRNLNDNGSPLVLTPYGPATPGTAIAVIPRNLKDNGSPLVLQPYGPATSGGQARGWFRECVVSIQGACTVKNLLASAVVIAVLLAVGCAAIRFPYVRFGEAVCGVFLSAGGGANAHFSSGDFTSAVERVPVVGNILSRLEEFKLFTERWTEWTKGVNVWMVGERGDQGVLGAVAKMEDRCVTMSRMFRFRVHSMSLQSARRTTFSAFLSNLKQERASAKKPVTMGTVRAADFVQKLQDDARAKNIKDLEERLSVYETAMKADADVRAALERGRAEREGAVLAELKKTIQDEFDAKLAAEASKFRRAQGTWHMEFEAKLDAEASKLRRAQGAWHTELIAGVIIGGLTVTVVALVSNPVLLVAVANGGGWVAAFAGTAQTVLSYCGVQSVIDAAASFSAAALAADAAAAAAAAAALAADAALAAAALAADTGVAAAATAVVISAVA